MSDNVASVAEVLLRIKVIEKILISNKITTQEELSKELRLMFNVVAKSILEKANVQGDLDEILKSMFDAQDAI